MKSYSGLLLLLTFGSATLAESEYPLPAPAAEDASRLQEYFEHVYSSGRARTAAESGAPLLLTPLVEGGELAAARRAAAVDPDQLLPDVDSYAGYLTVNKEYNSNLWFWYFPVADKPVESTPWIIWLQGGPGASSLYGLFTEIGPFAVTEDFTLEEIEYSWGKNHSLLFIDNPVGTGFSFTEDERGYATNQTTIGEQLYQALQQFLQIFPELRTAPLIIAGESYAGKHIPSLAIQIHRRKDSKDQPINLEGLAIGNGFIDPYSMQHYSAFVREVGLVDDRVADAMKYLEKAVVELLKKEDITGAYLYYNTLLNILMKESHLKNIYNYMQDNVGLEGRYTDFIQGGEVRRALHVGDNNFTSIGLVYRKLIPDFMNSAKPWLEELLEHYRVLCYSKMAYRAYAEQDILLDVSEPHMGSILRRTCLSRRSGHLDIIVAYHLSVSTHRSLNFSGAAEYLTAKRHPWYHNQQLVGYYKTGGNLTEVMLRRAGHMVPADVPGPALGLVSAFARGLTLDADTGPLAQPTAPLRSRALQPSTVTPQDGS